jgi:hypothetical protein
VYVSCDAITVHTPQCDIPHTAPLRQAAVKREAVDSSLAEQQRDQEAALAEGAAQDCMISQHEATVRRVGGCGGLNEWRASHASWARCCCCCCGCSCSCSCNATGCCAWLVVQDPARMVGPEHVALSCSF